MTDERGVVRRIAWRELFPWLVIARALRLSISPTVLLIATLGVFVSSIGWRIAPYIFFTEQGRTSARIPSDAFWTGEIPAWHRSLESFVPSAVEKYLPAQPSGVLDSFFRLAEPVRRLFSYELTVNQTAYYLFGFLWSLAVWAFVGGFITRRAVVQVALDDAPGLVETAQFAARRWPWYFLAPLYPLLGVLILVLLHVPLGWIMLLDFGVLIAGFFWIFVLLMGVAAAWLLIGTLLGWPLMWGALSADREGDAFDAFSRSFSYVYGRPLYYLFYAIVAALLGALGYAAAQVFIDVVYEFGFWAVSWGAGGERINEIRGLYDFASPERPVGHQLLAFWRSVAYTFLVGYAFAYFWNAAGIIYLLLRHDVDEKEMDEVYLPDEEPLSRPPTEAPATPAAASADSAAAPPNALAAEE
ncbi:MAG TPA: hypothetical protein VMP01_21260 [Pirellulaceae bacterium]|nr:hypothetical protein [Pirellulaceae bacterium]